MEGLGIGLSYLNPYSSPDTTPLGAVVVAEAMDRIRHRVALASIELDAQKAYLARSNRLVQMLRLDEEEKRSDGGEENDVDQDDLDIGGEVMAVETGRDVPTSRVASSGSSPTSGPHY